MDSLEQGFAAIQEGTDEPYVDAYIHSLVYKGRTLSAQELEAVDSTRPVPQDVYTYLNRLESLAGLVQGLIHKVENDTRFEPRNIERFKLVLALVLKLHIDDPDRADGSGPFVLHVLQVADRVLSLYTPQDMPFVVMAALLHDAIEDQAALLNIERRLAPEWNSGLTKEEIEREGAIETLGHFLGMRSRLIVEGVTTPLHDKKNLPQEEKNNIYCTWAKDIVYDMHNPARFVIKWADWEQNAFGLTALTQEIIRCKERGDVQSAEKKQTLHSKLRAKYKPVLTEIVLPFLQNDMPESHPLFYMRDDMIQELQTVLKEQYT